MKDLEPLILKILSYQVRTKKGFKLGALRWTDLRDILLREVKPENPNTFNVKVSRSLKRLEREGKIKKVEDAHKKVLYALNAKVEKPDVMVISVSAYPEDFEKKLIETPFLIDWNPHNPPTFEQFRREFFQKFEKIVDLKGLYGRIAADSTLAMKVIEKEGE